MITLYLHIPIKKSLAAKEIIRSFGATVEEEYDWGVCWTSVKSVRTTAEAECECCGYIKRIDIDTTESTHFMRLRA